MGVIKNQLQKQSLFNADDLDAMWVCLTKMEQQMGF
jgi:hypothetical protein